jgi:hypothetical protein
MRTPPHVVVHRLVAVVITVLILLVIGLGAPRPRRDGWDEPSGHRDRSWHD